MSESDMYQPFQIGSLVTRTNRMVIPFCPPSL